MDTCKNHTSLRTRMILLFLVLVLTTLLVTGFFSFYQTQRVLVQQKQNVLKRLGDKAQTHVSDILTGAVKATETVLYFTPIYNSIFITSDALPSEQLEAYRTSGNYLVVLEQQFDYERVRIFTRNKSLLYQQEGTHFFNYESLASDIPISPILSNRTEQVQVTDTYLYTPKTETESPRWQISVVRFLVDGPAMFVRAAVSIDLNAAKLLDGWTNENMDSFELALVNRNGTVLASSLPEKIATTLPPTLTDLLDQQTSLEKDGYYYISYSLEALGWQLYVSTPSSYLYEDTEAILATMLLMIFLSCLLCVIATIVISKALTERLRELTKSIEGGIEQTTLPGMLNMQIDHNDGDCSEISVLLYAYNRLLNRICSLSKENERAVLRESRYRMEALRLQINSHFLYNTLASIKGYVEMNDAHAASELIMELAAFFNRSLDRGALCIELREEIEIISIYLKIQKLAYADQFTWRIEIPDEMLSTRLPKFILQPIIENAVIHGIMESHQAGTILVEGRMLEDRVQIFVKDNGPGFKSDMLEDLHEQHYGIGMRNVRKRLGLYFGDNAKLWAENLQEGGGCIVVELPLGGLTQEESALYDKNSASR